MIRQIDAIEVGNPEKYTRALQEQVALEQQLRAGTGPKRIQYQADRSGIALALFSEIEEILEEEDSVDVIEIGAGDGMGSEELLRLVSGSPRTRDRVNISMTGLALLPSHQRLSGMEVSVYTGVLLNHLPLEWEERFDVVGTSFVLGYTDIEDSLRGIDRILRPGGVWIGFEGRDAVDFQERSIPQMVRHAMEILDMENQSGIILDTFSPFAREAMFKYVKP